MCGMLWESSDILYMHCYELMDLAQKILKVLQTGYGDITGDILS